MQKHPYLFWVKCYTNNKNIPIISFYLKGLDLHYSCNYRLSTNKWDHLKNHSMNNMLCLCASVKGKFKLQPKMNRTKSNQILAFRSKCTVSLRIMTIIIDQVIFLDPLHCNILLTAQLAAITGR